MEQNEFGTQKVLLTGAAGWLGQGLVHALVHGLPDCDRFKSPGPLDLKALILPGQDKGLRSMSPNIELVEGDLTDRTACDALCQGGEGAVLFHVAGVIHPRRVSEFDGVNLMGTQNILEAASKNGVRRAVVMSSNSPLGCNPHVNHLFDEQSPYHPYMGYGRSKMRMEQHVKSVQAQTQLETVIIRAPWFYGPHQPPRQKLFFEMIRDGKGPIVGGGENRRSMAYIDNLVQGLLLAAAVPEANGETYWIADKRPYTMNEIIDTIERLLETEFDQKCKRTRLRLPGLASEVAWLCDYLLQACGLYHQKIHVLSEMNKTIACSVEKAERDLGYRPTIALEEGMRRSLAELFGRAHERDAPTGQTSGFSRQSAVPTS